MTPYFFNGPRTNAVRQIDHALAALVDIKPMAEYGVVGSYDTVQARRQKALAQAEQALLNLRRELAHAAGADSPVKSGCWLSESFGKFLRDKGYTDEQIAAECASNGLPPPFGVAIPSASIPDEAQQSTCTGGKP
jgi:hypothetical protein